MNICRVGEGGSEDVARLDLYVLTTFSSGVGGGGEKEKDVGLETLVFQARTTLTSD